jgi:hypothetical protein
VLLAAAQKADRGGRRRILLLWLRLLLRLRLRLLLYHSGGVCVPPPRNRRRRRTPSASKRHVAPVLPLQVRGSPNVDLIAPDELPGAASGPLLHTTCAGCRPFAASGALSCRHSVCLEPSSTCLCCCCRPPRLLPFLIAAADASIVAGTSIGRRGCCLSAQRPRCRGSSGRFGGA